MAHSTISDETLDRLLYATSPYAPESPTGLSLRAQSDLDRILAGETITPPRHRPTRHRAIAWIAPAIAVVLVGIVIWGVQPFLHLSGPKPLPIAGTPSPLARVQNTPPQGVVASGTFLSPDGSTSGRVEVTVDGEQTVVTLIDVVSTHPVLSASTSLSSREADPCADTGVRFSWGDITTDQPTTLPLPPGDSLFHGDWTNVAEIVLTTFTAADSDTECINTIVAHAPLEWSMAPLRPWLATVQDAGRRDGANGPVTYADDGRPISYLVTSNDLIDEVAERFGISRDDLFYLNESRLPISQDPMLYVDETLNLDLSQR